MICHLETGPPCPPDLTNEKWQPVPHVLRPNVICIIFQTFQKWPISIYFAFSITRNSLKLQRPIVYFWDFYDRGITALQNSKWKLSRTQLGKVDWLNENKKGLKKLWLNVLITELTKQDKQSKWHKCMTNYHTNILGRFLFLKIQLIN